MIRIYSGNLTNAILHSLKVHENVYDDLDHQETKEQLAQFDKLVNKHKKGFCLITNSLILINYINLLILKDIVKYEDVEALYFYNDNTVNLKIDKYQIVNTKPFNIVLDEIYEEYFSIKRKQDAKQD